METLVALGALLRARNAIDREICTILGRPAHVGQIGEYVASMIFDIALYPNASHKSSDGLFKSGPLAGKSVNIKYMTKGKGVLNLASSSDHSYHPDYYLVLTGPKSPPISMKGSQAPWVISFVYLFQSRELLERLAMHTKSPGIATSIGKQLWAEAEIYPTCQALDHPLRPTPRQIELLSLFAGVTS